MKAKFTLIVKSYLKIAALVAFISATTVAFGQAGAPFQGGRTYWVDGTGNDLVMPKDTFRNLMGFHILDQPYNTNTGIITALNNQGTDPTTIGAINFILTSGYSGLDSGIIQIGRTTTGGYPFMAPTRPITIRPASGTNITLSAGPSVILPAGSAMVRFTGAQYITLQGESTPGENNLTISLPASAATSTYRLIDIIATVDNGCQSISINNCNLIGSSTTSGVNTFAGIYSGGLSTAPPVAPARRNQNISIIGNIIEAVRNPIYMRGIETAANSQDLGLNIDDNLIGGVFAPGGATNTTFIGGVANAAGITLISQANAIVQDNTIRNSIPTVGGFVGIAVVTSSGNQTSLDSNVVIDGNEMYNYSTNTASSGVYGVRINLGTHTTKRDIVLTNNTIGNIYATNGSTTRSSGLYTCGVLIESSAPDVGVSLIHNTINLYRDTLNVGSFSGCIVTGANVSGGLIVRNNILSNRMGRATLATGNAPFAYLYIINSLAANPIVPVVSGNNAYYINNTSGAFSMYGFITNRNYESFNGWKSIVIDTFSLIEIPAFIGVNDTTMRLTNGTISRMGNTGRGFGVAVDILGNSRSATTPSIGAYEFVGDAVNENYALRGGVTYPINGTSAWPVGVTGSGSFSTMADAVTYLNTFGVTNVGNAPINLVFSPGYTGETTRIPPIIDYRGASFNTRVVFRPAPGANYTVSTPFNSPLVFNQYSLVSFIGADYVTINGEGTPGQRNLTFSIPSNVTNTTHKVISVASGDATRTISIQILNTNIVGASTTTLINTAAGIYHGHFYPATGAFSSALVDRNDTLVISNNSITAVRTGIYLRGANSGPGQNRQVTIYRNTIGGTVKRDGVSNINVLGGATNQAGIYLKSISTSVVDSNIIQNTDSTTAVSSGFRGIELDAASEAGLDSAISITRNTISNLTTVTGQFCNGIRVNLGNGEARRVTIINNNISNINGIGASAGPSTSNPAAISVDATAVVLNLGIDVMHNTVNMAGNGMSAANSSYCVYFGANVQGGVRLQNNILTNKLGRASVGAGFSYALFTATTNANIPFLPTKAGFINGNAYGSQAPNTNPIIIGNSSANFATLTDWRTASTVDFNSFAFNAQFLSNQSAILDPIYSGPLAAASQVVSTVGRDIVNANRTGLFTSTGSLVFVPSFSPLRGNTTYLINGTNNFPGGGNTPPFSFQTINRAFVYLNSNGVDSFSLPAQQITLMIASGYAGEGDTLITPLIQYPKMNQTRTVVLKTDVGRNDTIRTTGIAQPYAANSSVLRIAGASFFTLDGDNGSGGRNLTVMLPVGATLTSCKLIDLVAAESPVTNVTIRNCNLIGNSSGATTINTFAGVYLGGITATPSAPVLTATRGNNNNIIENNFIGGVRNGVYLQGLITPAGSQDRNNIVRRNFIGGSLTAPNTDYFGGVTNAAGIYLNSQAVALVDSNVIRNNVPSFAGARGIDLGATTGALSLDSAVTVTKNTIYNISNTLSGAAYGISMSLLGDSTTNITMSNNMISGISSVGSAGAAIGLANPFGIYIDATSNVNDIGVNLWYNSINLGLGTSLGSSINAASSCITFGPAIRGGVSMRNNILQNRLGRTSGAGSAAGVLVGHNANIFTASDNNNYWIQAPGATNSFMMLLATATVPTRYDSIPPIQALTRQDTMSISFVAPFTNDTILTFANTSNVFHGWAKSIPAVTQDIFGSFRNSQFPTIGAQEMNSAINFIDSIRPRAYNVTPLASTCSNGPFTINYRVFERNLDLQAPGSETFFYSVNGAAEVAITSATTAGLPLYSRNFTIPGQSPNASIAYRYVATDKGGRTVSIPATGYDYTSTSFNQFPITLGFDIPNVNGWTIQNEGPNANTPATGGWNIDTYGSGLSPVITPQTGIKAALFQSGQLASGSKSRLVSPCLDFTNAKVPSVRIWVSQNGEALTNLDAVSVVVTGGFGIWSAPLGTVVRPVSGLAFPRFTQLDVCLSSFVGVSGIRVGIEALSRGGQNIVLDSIVIFDDVLPTSVTPSSNTICAYDSLTLTLPTGIANYAYRIVDAFTFDSYSNEFNGNGSALTIKGVNRNVDTLVTMVRYRNRLSGCSNNLNDTARIYTKRFFGGPFISPGTPFTGVFSSTAAPDGAKVGDNMRYNFPPPSGLTNADYGTKWTIVNRSVASAAGRALSSSTFTAPSGPTNANYLLNIGAADADSTFILRATVRLLPTNCDSVFARSIKVTSAPVASFTSKDSTCLEIPIFFTNTTTFLPSTGPLSYAWDFGDGTTASTVDANKTYRGVAPGLYTVKMRATNNAGVFSETTKQIRVLGIPSTAYTATLACGKDSSQFTNITPGSNLSYLWTVRFNNATVTTSTAANPKFSFALSDTLYAVTLRATDVLGCRKDTTTNVFSFAKPVAAFTTGAHCLNLNAVLTNTSTITPGINGRVNNFGSEWDFGNGQIGLSNAPIYKYPAAGTYTVKLKTTSNYGCIDSTSRTIRVFEKPNTGFTLGATCQYDVLNLTNTTTYSGGLNKVLFQWNFGDNSGIITDANPQKTYGTLGLKTITLVANDTVNFCFDTTRTTITVSEKPIAAYSAEDGCVGNRISFNNATIPPAGETLTYSWTFGNDSTSTETNPKTTYKDPGTYFTRLTATTGKGCQDIATDSVRAVASPIPGIIDSIVNCSTIQLKPGAAIDPNLTYRWVFGDGTVITGNGAPVTNVYQRKGKYQVSLIATDNRTLCAGTSIDSVITTCTVSIDEVFRSKYSLSMYPNPFEELANINYNLDKSQNVIVSVYDVLGRKVLEVKEMNQSVGNHTIKLDETKFNATSALYMVKIQIGEDTVTKQLLHK